MKKDDLDFSHDGQYIPFRESFYEFCGGNIHAALILSYIETQRRYQRKKNWNFDGFVDCSATTIQRKLHFSKPSILKAMKLLDENNFITIKKVSHYEKPNVKVHYATINLKVLQNLLDERNLTKESALAEKEITERVESLKRRYYGNQPPM